MSKDQLRIPDYLEHIQAAIERIRRYTHAMSGAALTRKFPLHTTTRNLQD